MTDATNSPLEADEMSEGISFLLGRGLMAKAGENEQGSVYGITEAGMNAIYMLGLVLAGGETLEEMEGGDSVPVVREVSRCAAELVDALVDYGMGSG